MAEVNNVNLNNSENNEDEISILELLTILWRKKFLIISCFVIAVAIAIAYLFVATPIYNADVTIMVSPLTESSSISSLLLGGGSSSSSKISTEVELLTSRKTIDSAMTLLDLSSYHDSEGVPYSEKELTSDVIAKKLDVTTVSDTNIVRITVSDPSPEFARDLANAIADSYNELLTSFVKDSSASSLAFVESQIPINQEQVEKAAQALADFQKEKGMMQLTQASQVALLKYNYMLSRMAPIRLEESEADAMLLNYSSAASYEVVMQDAEINSILKDITTYYKEMLMYDLLSVSSSSASSSSRSLSASLTTAQQDRYYTLSQNMTTAERSLSDRIRKISTLSGADAQNYARAMTQKVTAENQLTILTSEAEKENATLDDLPEVEKELAQLQSQVQVYQTMSVTLLQMQQEAKLVDASVSDNVTGIDRAILPLEPVSPKKLMVLAVGAFIGLAIGVLIAILLELSDKSICSSDELKKILPPDVPFLGWIPMIKVKQKNRYFGTVVHDNPSCFESERYKLIASPFIFGHKKEKEHRVVTVCSTEKNEGKTSVMANIAVALTQNGFRVLLVDGDLRMPSCEQFFNLEHQQRGLVDIVMDNENINNCIVQPLADIPTLHLLPRGSKPIIPSAVFAAPEFSTLVENLKLRYDIILFDAPPLEYASELLTLTQNAHEVLIVIRAGIANRVVLLDLINSFKSANVTVDGVCLNAVIYSHGVSHGSGGYGYGSYTNANDESTKSIVKRIPFFASRKNYYRRRYKRDNKYRNASKSIQRRIRAIHPLAPHLDDFSIDETKPSDKV